MAGAQTDPSTAEEPLPACMQTSVERSSSLPPTACLAAARSNFLCTVPTAAATIPRACTARLSTPLLITPPTSLRTSQPVSLMLCAPLHRDPCCTLECLPPAPLDPPCACKQRGGMGMAEPGWASMGYRD